MRKKQREEQKELDGESQKENNGQVTTPGSGGYCKTCKLTYKHQSKCEHEETEFHKRIVMFLHPKCTICNVPNFFSALAYEKHIATLGHIKVCVFI